MPTIVNPFAVIRIWKSVMIRVTVAHVNKHASVGFATCLDFETLRVCADRDVHYHIVLTLISAHGSSSVLPPTMNAGEPCPCSEYRDILQCPTELRERLTMPPPTTLFPLQVHSWLRL